MRKRNSTSSATLRLSYLRPDGYYDYWQQQSSTGPEQEESRMKGWFDGFRQDGGPTIYSYSNRTSVTADVSTITICLLFFTVFFGFLLIFPGVRKERLSTFCTVTLSLLTGSVICVCSFGSEWHAASGDIVSSYRAFSRHKIHASLGVWIGLNHANVTLRIIPEDNRTLDINYNERFYWVKPTEMKHHYQDALVKGLPYPILTVAEYLSWDSEGFAWGRFYRTAGYYTNIVMWSAFASWCLMNILMLNVPRYGAYLMMLTGSLMCSACLIFWLFRPPSPLVIRFETGVLSFQFGWCFWLTLVNGGIVAFSGLLIALMDWIHPHKFSTILEVDFDTPYDRHIILEDSLDTRKRRFKIPRLEEPLNAGFTVGSRLLRRLSKRGKDGNDEQVQEDGFDNMAFEMESTKSSWKYPNFIMRSDSKKSEKSAKNSNGSIRSQPFLDIPVRPDDKGRNFSKSDWKQSSISSNPVVSSPKSVNFHSSGIPDPLPLALIKRQDSSQSCASSSSSFGIGMLSRGSSIRRISGEEAGHPAVTRNNSANIIVFHRTDSRGQLQRLEDGMVEIQTEDD